ncbi:hypothetical protein IF2G_04300 [Cordyceps javanica]|nr:hypothetical protein IF2G_04300 [Cordyceps javanica]
MMCVDIPWIFLMSGLLDGDTLFFSSNFLTWFLVCGKVDDGEKWPTAWNILTLVNGDLTYAWDMEGFLFLFCMGGLVS